MTGALGGPLALVLDGAMIEVDVEARRLQLEVADEELERCRANWKRLTQAMKGGYQQLYIKHVTQADKGADFDFLIGCRGSAVPREPH